jgi:hypothetical protein
VKPSVLPAYEETWGYGKPGVQDAVERRDEARTILWLVKLWRDSPEYQGNFPQHIRDAIERAFGEHPA